MRVGRYEVEGEIARGGMGAVFRARGPGGRPVAVKVLLNASSGRSRQRFLREAHALAKLRHRNLVAVHDAGETEAGPYLVMEYVDGVSLAQRIERDELPTPAEAVRLTLGLAEALQHCHAHGVIHRDIKPGNVLIDREGEACLTDFGLAHDADPELSRLSKSGTYIGSPGFWPPEQATGDLDRLGTWSDVYALGATLHAMLTGEPPFEFDSLVSAVIAAIEQPPNLSGVDAHLDALIADCLAKEPLDRPELDEVVRRLADWSPGQARAPARLPRRAVAGLAALAGAGLLAGAVALAAPLLSAPPFEPPPIPCVVAPWEAELPHEAWRLLQEGRAAFRKRDFEASADRYLAAQRAAPGISRLHALRGVSLNLQGKKKEALVEIDQAVKLDPDDAQVRYNRGALRCDLGDPKGALEDLDRVLAKLPEKANAWYARGAVNYQLGRYDQSIADHNRAEALDPRNAQNIASRAAARDAKGDPKGALEDLDKAHQLRPKSVDVLSERAELKRKLDDTEGAIRDYTAALALRPDDANLRVRRGKALLRAKDFKGAHDDFDAAVPRRPNDAGLLQLRGLTRYRLGDRQGAQDDLERARALIPDDDPRQKQIQLWLEKVRATGGR